MEPIKLSQPQDAINESPVSVPKILPSEAAYTRSGLFLAHVREVPKWTPEQAAAMQAICEGLKNPKGSIFVLWGRRGTGKTLMAAKAAMLAPGDKIRYALACNISREIRSTYRKESPLSEIEVINSFLKPLVLIIDESQERGETEFDDRTLTHIVDARYGNFLHTIIISNLTKEELGKSLGASIVSRVHEIGKVIECNWESFREVKP